MKNLIAALFLLINLAAFAQKPCELDANINDSVGTYKSTKQYMIFERSFAGNSTHVFFALTNTNGAIGVEAQILQRSPDFIKATCFDSGSRIFLQLQNGKIVSLLHAGNGNCGTLLVGEKGINNRVLTGTFLFARENYEDLKTSPVTFMRIKYGAETVDYPFMSGFVSELDKTMYEPENYFRNYIKCIEAN